ncbi:MAG: hypothetical protein J5917_05375 [Bacteroidales bacterium]|nr:hypothetical protein [Bacteroidales bacterium]
MRKLLRFNYLDDIFLSFIFAEAIPIGLHNLKQNNTMSGTTLYQITENDLTALAAKLIDQYRATHPDQQTAAKPEDTKPRFYTRKEAADILKTTLPTIHAMMNDGSIRFTKANRKTLIFADYLDEAVKSGKLAKYQRRAKK